jgi:phosphinothricin acetyltransferase
VENTTISFELEPPTTAEILNRIQSYRSFAPWLVCQHEENVVGYVYGSRFQSRPGYDPTAQVSVYIDAAYRSKGVGRALYTALFGCLRTQGFHTAVAGITLPNAASVALHQRMGFALVGTYRDVGYKMSGWHDVSWWQMELQPRPKGNPRIIWPDKAMLEPAWKAAIEQGSSLLYI